MSGVDFEPVPFRPELFDAEWQQQLATQIRLAAAIMSKTKTELCDAFASHPDAMGETFEDFSHWAELLTAYQDAVAAAAARIFIAAGEVVGKPVCDQAGIGS